MRSRRNSRPLPVARLPWKIAACALTALLLMAAAPPADKDDLLRDADAYADQGRLAQARSAYERAIAAGARLDNDFPRAYNLGLCYLNGKPQDFGKAAQWLENAVRANPRHDDARINLAHAYAWGRRFDRALEQFRILYAAHPDSTAHINSILETGYAAHRMDEVAPIVQEYLERRPSDVNTRLAYARILGYQRHFPEAMAQYQSVLADDPSNLAAQIGQARIASWQGDLANALELYAKVLRRNPNLYDAEVGRAFVLLWMGKKEEARPLFEALAKRNRNDKDVAAALKEIGPPAPIVLPSESRDAAAAGRTPAPSEVSAAIAGEKPAAPANVPPDPALVLRELMFKAEGAAARADYVEAIHFYHQVLEKDPSRTDAALQIARVLSWSRNYAASVGQYDELLASHPEALLARVERARVLSWSHEFEKSTAGYAEVLEQIEKDPEAAAKAGVAPNDVRLEYARVLSWSRKYDQSLEQVAKLLPEKPEAKDFDAVLLKARVLSYARRYDESLAAYDVALSLKPGDVEALTGKGQALYWSGNLPAAAAVLRPLVVQQTEEK